MGEVVSNIKCFNIKYRNVEAAEILGHLLILCLKRQRQIYKIIPYGDCTVLLTIPKKSCQKTSIIVRQKMTIDKNSRTTLQETRK